LFAFIYNVLLLAPGVFYCLLYFWLLFVILLLKMVKKLKCMKFCEYFFNLKYFYNFQIFQILVVVHAAKQMKHNSLCDIQM